MHATGLPPGGRTDFGALGADHVLDVGGDVQLFCDDFLLTRGHGRIAGLPDQHPVHSRQLPSRTRYP